MGRERESDTKEWREDEEDSVSIFYLLLTFFLFAIVVDRVDRVDRWSLVFLFVNWFWCVNSVGFLFLSFFLLIHHCDHHSDHHCDHHDHPSGSLYDEFKE